MAVPALFCWSSWTASVWVNATNPTACLWPNLQNLNSLMGKGTVLPAFEPTVRRSECPRMKIWVILRWGIMLWELGACSIKARNWFPNPSRLALFSSQNFGANWSRAPKASKKSFHFIGLLSDGNVHSHIDQLFALVRRCAQEGVKSVCIHALLDGRDVYEKSAPTFIEKTESLLREINTAHPGFNYRIASGGGRMIVTMDRYNADWKNR